MALNATVLTITQPGATGNQTYSLPANFDPKAIIVMGSLNQSTGITAMMMHCIGFGTYRGGAVQQMWMSQQSEDNTVGHDSYGRTYTDAVCKLTSGATNTIVANIALVSMQTGGTSQIVLNWVTRYATAANLKLSVLVLGGSDITDASCAQFTTGTGGAGNQDVTVVSGFGKPDLLFAAHGGDTSAVGTIGGESPYSFAFNNQAAGGRLSYFNTIDGGAAADTRARIDNNKILFGGIGTASQQDAVLAAPANWPTDGFRVTYTTRSANWPVNYLALRLSASAAATVGQGTVPTSGTQTLSPSSGTARAMFIMGLRTTTVNTDITSGADNGYASYGLFANDGTQSVFGVLDLDGASTSVTDTAYDSTKVLNFYNPTGEGKTAEASAAVSGNNVVLTWSDPDTSAWIYEWLILSEIVPASATGNFFPFLT